VIPTTFEAPEEVLLIEAKAILAADEIGEAGWAVEIRVRCRPGPH
jgi:hypothetical protein